MRGVELAFEVLEVIAKLQPLGHEELIVVEKGPLELGEFGDLVARAHVDPDEATGLVHLVGKRADGFFVLRVRRLGRLLEADAFGVELPAVVGAADALLLVSTPKEAGVAVWATCFEDRRLARRGPERDELLTEQAERDGSAVWLGKLSGEQRRRGIRKLVGRAPPSRYRDQSG